MVGKFKKFVDVVGQEIKEALINDPYIFPRKFFFLVCLLDFFFISLINSVLGMFGHPCLHLRIRNLVWE